MEMHQNSNHRVVTSSWLQIFHDLSFLSIFFVSVLPLIPAPKPTGTYCKGDSVCSVPAPYGQDFSDLTWNSPTLVGK
jgi:hypothetical protein